jgi:hypothetical protein
MARNYVLSEGTPAGDYTLDVLPTGTDISGLTISYLGGLTATISDDTYIILAQGPDNVRIYVQGSIIGTPGVVISGSFMSGGTLLTYNNGTWAPTSNLPFVLPTYFQFDAITNNATTLPFLQVFNIHLPAVEPVIIDIEWLYSHGTYSSSQTITHKTDIIGFDKSQIGTFCETTGQVADVYGANYIPTLDRATDAIVKVRQSACISRKILGIITSADKFASHGDAVARVVDGSYELGDLIIPDASGLCRKASEEEALFLCINGCPKVRITAKIADNAEIVAEFIQ